ncbi:hypothetical protein FCL40_03365 [Ferrimonas sediminicola]|uniref:EamA domain-containing protein n=1 Tax=Ferrimonas sediminicola TaxID=2569538 RepID=A0A4U1BNC2_9GAMM|nr:EamA family transporter [Ferrimonas sediminicola]TKB51608.1 hypothetical protein FCL40_03365 [Ferrimonas sediminicola]
MGILSFTGWQLTFGGLFLAPIALFCEGLPQSLTTTHLLGYGYLSLVGTALCYLLWFRGIEKLPVITTSFLGFLTSLSACLLGFFVLNQALSKMQLVGGLAIVSAIFLSTAKPRASRPLAISSQSELTGTRQDLC